MPYSGLIVGLGNPGSRYARTRHNFGFMLADLFMEHAQRQLNWTCSPRQFKGKAETWDLRSDLDSQRWLVVKPMTFMNLSGQVVGQLCRQYIFAPEKIIILHDEVDLPLGVVRLKFSGGLAGHNGLKSIAAHLGTRDFARLRLGIGRPLETQSLAEYVLRPFLPLEGEALNSALTIALEALVNFCFLGLEQAIQELHSS